MSLYRRIDKSHLCFDISYDREKINLHFNNGLTVQVGEWPYTITEDGILYVFKSVHDNGDGKYFAVYEREG